MLARRVTLRRRDSIQIRTMTYNHSIGATWPIRNLPKLKSGHKVHRDRGRRHLRNRRADGDRREKAEWIILIIIVVVVIFREYYRCRGLLRKWDHRRRRHSIIIQIQVGNCSIHGRWSLIDLTRLSKEVNVDRTPLCLPITPNTTTDRCQLI